MKKNEEKYLKKLVADFRKYTRTNNTILSMYDNIDTFSFRSLQDLSFKSDLKLFKDFEFILSVITSIISRPHYANKAEELIVRSSQASTLQNDMLIKTIEDARMWKRNGIEMLPEHVYYQQYIDDIKTYENIFIVFLINLINNELDKYQDFYCSAIQSFDGKNKVLSSNANLIEDAIVRLNKLQRQMLKIKSTYFYREINRKCNVELTQIIPSNILLQNRLYNHCYKFYLKLISYNDKNNLKKDFLVFYYGIILLTLKKHNLKLLKAKNLKDENAINGYTINMVPNLVFYNDEIKIILNVLEELNAFDFIFEYKKEKFITRHLLIVDENDNFEKKANNFIEQEIYHSCEVISIWKKAVLDQQVTYDYVNTSTEKEMIDQYLTQRLFKISASKAIYSHYCPVCKHGDVECDEEIYTCEKCKSTYRFSETEDQIIFIKIRRKL